MQRISQDWLVLQASGGSGAALGMVTALQFLPILVLGPLGGTLADLLPRRATLLVVNLVNAAAGAGLAWAVLTGNAPLGVVYAAAVASGCLSAIEGPLRSAFLHDIAGGARLGKVIALESASGNLARLIGPVTAGALIATAGVGWAIAANAVSYLAVVVSLLVLRTHAALTSRIGGPTGSWREASALLRSRGDLLVVLGVTFFASAFGFNFVILNALMATDVFGRDAAAFGALASITAIGSLTGAVTAAGRSEPRIRRVAGAGSLFGVCVIAASVMPSYLTYCATLVAVGAASMTTHISVTTYLQLAVPNHVRGRMMAAHSMVFAGGTTIGAPVIGWVAGFYDPRVALLVSGSMTLAGALICGAVFASSAGLALSLRRGREQLLPAVHVYRRDLRAVRT